MLSSKRILPMVVAIAFAWHGAANADLVVDVEDMGQSFAMRKRSSCQSATSTHIVASTFIFAGQERQ